MQRWSTWLPLVLCVGCADGSSSFPAGSNGTAPGQVGTDSGETDTDGEGSGGVASGGAHSDTSGGAVCSEGDGCGIGDPCSNPESCASGFCVDGVCCETACDGVCERCDPLGTCIADSPASDPECGDEGEASNWTIGLGAPVDVEAEPNSNFDRGSGTVVDEMGNVYLVGTFNQQVDFGGGVEVAVGDDPFIVSYTPEGAYRWHTHFGGPGHDTAGGVALLPGANEIVFVGASTGDPGLPGVWPDGQLNAVVATFNRDTGAVTGARALEATEQSRSLAVATDASGIYVTGGFRGTFQPGTQTAVGEEDLFAVRLDAALQPTWTWTDGGAFKDLGRAVAVSPAGDVALTGYRSVSDDSQNIIVTRFNAPLGATPAWHNDYASPPAGAAKGHAVAWTPDGDVLMAGFYTGPVQFGQSTADGGGRDAVLARLDGGSGATVWANTYGGASDDHFRALAVDVAGNTFIAGDFSETITVGAALTSNGGKDALVAKIDPDGNVVWSRAYGGASHDNGNAIALSADGTFFTAGHYRESTSFETIALSAAEGADIFLMRLGQ